MRIPGNLARALAILHELLSRPGTGFIVVGSLADLLLGVPQAKPSDVDILVSRKTAHELARLATTDPRVSVVRPVEYRAAPRMRGWHGTLLVGGVSVDVLAETLLLAGDAWVLFAYENLLPCTLEARVSGDLRVRIPCPEIQYIADKALSRHERARALEGLLGSRRCPARIDECLARSPGLHGRPTAPQR